VEVTATQASTAQQTNTATTSGYDRLAKADFLSLLVAQLKYQDPMNPMDNREFTTQLAQLQALEQAQQTNEAMLAMTYLSQIGQASNLVGRTITATALGGGQVSGTVTGVSITDGVAELLVNGQAVGLHELTGIS
jgi:flagellar basal-body rod modification protein FlgD